MQSFLTNALNLIIFMPLFGALLVFMLPKGTPNLARWTALVATLPTLLLAIAVFYSIQNGEANEAGYYLVYKAEWFPQIGSNWHVGVDGVSAAMMLLTALLTPLTILIAFEHGEEENPRAILGLILFMQMAMMGVFLTLDMVAFFIFWELGLVPMYFIINQWGGANRRYASNKFFIYTMAGSLGLLLAIQLIAFSVGDVTPGAGPTFDIPTWLNEWPMLARDGDATILGFTPAGVKYLAFLAFFVAFAIKIPVWPFHTWLPDAHTEAPTAGSMLLAGVLLKQGAYGFIRFVIPLFPDVVATPYTPTIPIINEELDFLTLNFASIIAGLAMLGIVLGAFAAWAQDDFKKLVAYSSVNHMGFVVMGIAVLAVVYSTTWAASIGDYDLALKNAGEVLVDEDIATYRNEFPVSETTIEELPNSELQGLAQVKFDRVVQLDPWRPEVNGEEFDRDVPGTRKDAQTALNGAVMQMFNHGLSAAAMFLLVGALYHKAHTRDLRRFGGLWHTVPVFGGLLVFTSMASLGLPGLNGFTGEWLIIAGSFRLFPVMVLISMIGLLITGAYILKGLQKVLHGPPNEEWIDYHNNEHSLEINFRETVAIAPLVALMLVTGLYPNWILEVINGTVSRLF